MTLPTGRIAGSAAAMPVRTPTPDAVVSPLQYAVAENCSRAPACGNTVVSVTVVHAGFGSGIARLDLVEQHEYRGDR